MIGVAIESPFWRVAAGPASVLIGVNFIGIALPFLKTPIIPLYKEELEKVMLNKENVNDMASSFYTMGAALGNLIMPLMGGIIYDSYGGAVDPVE
jgi:dipeptide/tripeptide permease